MNFTHAVVGLLPSEDGSSLLEDQISWRMVGSFEEAKDHAKGLIDGTDSISQWLETKYVGANIFEIQSDGRLSFNYICLSPEN